ncbi:MAG: hypothetical protein ACLU4P_09680 [Ruminococcus sp.]
MIPETNSWQEMQYSIQNGSWEYGELTGEDGYTDDESGYDPDLLSVLVMKQIEGLCNWYRELLVCK